MRISVVFAVLATALALGGCDGTEAALKFCTAATEPTILLRQLVLRGQKRENFKFCEDHMAPAFDCDGIYLDADQLTTDCMKQRGFVLKSKCLGKYHDSGCYESQWVADFSKFFRQK